MLGLIFWDFENVASIYLHLLGSNHIYNRVSAEARLWFRWVKMLVGL